mmetsp:Transcript_3272/g.12226  ORF Transcript_3272/g.12226 Transcript_3272/m.12226 type:complete len:219 (+) Transcript_3272:701-1357(+)
MYVSVPNRGYRNHGPVESIHGVPPFYVHHGKRAYRGEENHHAKRFHHGKGLGSLIRFHLFLFPSLRIIVFDPVPAPRLRRRRAFYPTRVRQTCVNSLHITVHHALASFLNHHRDPLLRFQHPLRDIAQHHGADARAYQDEGNHIRLALVRGGVHIAVPDRQHGDEHEVNRVYPRVERGVLVFEVHVEPPHAEQQVPREQKRDVVYDDIGERVEPGDRG